MFCTACELETMSCAHFYIEKLSFGGNIQLEIEQQSVAACWPDPWPNGNSLHSELLSYLVIL